MNDNVVAAWRAVQVEIALAAEANPKDDRLIPAHYVPWTGYVPWPEAVFCAHRRIGGSGWKVSHRATGLSAPSPNTASGLVFRFREDAYAAVLAFEQSMPWGDVTRGPEIFIPASMDDAKRLRGGRAIREFLDTLPKYAITT